MSLDDLRRVTGHRVVQDARLTNSMMAVVSSRRAFNDCQRANDGLMRVIANKDASISLMSEQVDAHMKRADKWQRKAKRRSPWALIGKVAVGVVAVRGGAELYRMAVR